MYIDSHAHITSEILFPQVDELLARAQEYRIEKIINICTGVQSLEKGLLVAQKYPWVFNSAATTPHDVEKEGEQVFPIMEEHALAGKLVAIGETGLDYHYTHSSPDIQKYFLKKYFHLALKCNLPVIIHCRDAFADFFQILDQEYLANNKDGSGVLHCFTGTLDEAKQVLDRGWTLSLSGIVTFKKSEQLKEVAKMVPLDQLLIETDSPYLAPQSKRGKTNEPAFLPEIAAHIAELRGISIETVAQATSGNAKKLFRLP